jgi:hypothetical protein
MAEVIQSGIEALARFARGLQDDLTAVTAGLTLAWSNGVTEGQIHRLKLVKRQGYGRAGFALVRQRVLQTASVRRVAHPQRGKGCRSSQQTATRIPGAPSPAC